MPFVILLHPDASISTHEVRDTLTLGARKDNDVVVAQKGISRRHAQIVQEGDAYVVEDLNSTNFVFVDDEQVKRQPLQDGNVLSLGGYATLLFLETLDHDRIQTWVEEQSAPEDSRSTTLDQTTRIYHKDLPKTLKELEALIEVGAQLARISNTDTVLDDILEKVLQLMQADRGFIMLLNDQGVLEPVYSQNMEKDLDEADGMTYSTSFARKVIEQQKTLVSTNVAEDPRFQSESIISQRILSIMCAPLRCADKLLGCLYIDVRESVRYYSDEDAAFFTALANQAAIAIDNSRLTADLRQERENLEHANVKLKESLQEILETNRKLDRKVGEISALYEASRDLNLATDVESVLRKILEQCREVVDCERASLMMYDRQRDAYVTRLVSGADAMLDNPVYIKIGQGIAGKAVQQRQGIIANQGCHDPGFLAARSERDSQIRHLMAVPLVSGDRGFGIINLINSNSEGGFCEDDLHIISSMANLASASIEKFNLLKAKVQQEKLNQQIEDAQQVQQLLLPRSMPESPYFEFSAKYTLANRVGGDYYDFIQLPEGRTALVIADVSGHDIASALVMAMGRNLIRILFDSLATPAEVLARTSQVLRKDTQAARYITMFLAILDPAKMTMTYSNAGHPYPFFLSENDSEIQFLEVGGFPLGLVDDFHYMEETRKLRAEDLLVLYTDGLVEAQAPSGDMYELDRLQQSILTNRAEPTAAITQNVYGEITRFVGSSQLEDDLTFVAMRVKSPREALTLSFPSRRDLVANYRDRVIAFLRAKGYLTDAPADLDQALSTVLTSAVVDGNQENPEKLVHIQVVPEGTSARLSIRSEGGGASSLFQDSTLQMLTRCARSVQRSEGGDELLVTFVQDGARS